MPERIDYTYLILGGGMVADSASRGIRELDERGTIGIVAEELTPPVTRPALSKKLWTDPEFGMDEVWLNTEEDTGAVRHAGVRATEIDPAARTVTGDDGTVFGYERLLLATGGRPRQLDLPADERVICFRSVEDYGRLRELSGDGKRIGVVGGSFIGTEIAAALVQNESKVSLIFPEETLGGAVFPPGLAERFQALYERAGVELIPGATVEGGTADDAGIELALSDGGRREVDALVVGLGVEPAVAIAEQAGLEVGDGVLVDDRLRTADPRIYAAGDIASYPDPILGRQRIEHVDNAVRMGKQAGRNLAGADEAYDHTPYFYSAVFGNRYEAVGTLDAGLETIEDRDDGSDSEVVYYLDDGRLRGVLLWNVDGQTDAARRLLSEPGPQSGEKLRGRIPFTRESDGE